MFSLLTEQAAGVYHRESRKGRYQLTYREAKAVCKFEGGTLATYDQLEAARQIGLYHTYKSHLDQMPKEIAMEIVMDLAYSVSVESRTSHVTWIILNSLYYNNKQSETISKQNDNQHSHRYIKYLHTSYKQSYKPSPVPPSVMFEL